MNKTGKANNDVDLLCMFQIVLTQTSLLIILKTYKRSNLSFGVITYDQTLKELIVKLIS